ncbi:Clp protease N-terminal domain-containing protein [Streptomyces sp. NPDC051217]|uniref:Clp protease N-terminal domain-containing protein n=1 Tax=Streptomyces sp. NPDC051217 TaxID=3365644 RepID=UPI00378D0FB3
MEQRQTADLTTVTTTEFASDAVELLSKTVRHAVGRGPAVGTEHLLYALLDDTDEPGTALVPRGRDSGSVRGQIRGREEQNWARDDSGVSGESDAPDDVHASDDAIEVAAAWREALCEAARASKPLREEGAKPPRLSPALRRTLLGALRLAREEGAPDAHERHLARALLRTPESRALEALALCRVDPAAGAGALDAQAEAVRAGGAPWPSEAAGVRGTVKAMRNAGLLGERGVWWMRGMMSWMGRSSGDGSPVVVLLSSEAQRQAVRYGRSETEPVDLLLAVMALDRGLTVAGLSLPGELLVANSAAQTLRSAGVREADLVRAATAAANPAPEIIAPASVERSVETDQVVAAARLLAAERKDETVGTTHILWALLADPGSPAAQLLRETGTDPTELRNRLDVPPAA